MKTTRELTERYDRRDFDQYKNWPASYRTPPTPQQLRDYLDDQRTMPEALFHATVPDCEEQVREEGIQPANLDAEASTDGIHEDRVFLSRFSRPEAMNLPGDKVDDAVVLQVQPEALTVERTYPDDSLYAAWYQGQFRGAEAIACFPEQYEQYCQSGGGDVGFEAWLVDERERMLGEESVNEVWAGRYELTMNVFDGRGELGYDGVIPPEAIQGRA